jgi:hypothetical protein
MRDVRGRTRGPAAAVRVGEIYRHGVALAAGFRRHSGQNCLLGCQERRLIQLPETNARRPVETEGAAVEPGTQQHHLGHTAHLAGRRR